MKKNKNKSIIDNIRRAKKEYETGEYQDWDEVKKEIKDKKENGVQDK